MEEGLFYLTFHNCPVTKVIAYDSWLLSAVEGTTTGLDATRVWC